MKEKKVEDKNNMVYIEVKKVKAPRIAMRGDLDKKSIEQLAKSIQEIGLICPICVMRLEEGFEIVAGNRRFEAVKELGWKELPAIVLEENSETYFRTMSAENYEREDINIYDEVQFIERLTIDLQMSQIQIAKYIGKSPSYVNERIAVLEYPQCLLDALLNNKITFSVAREFHKIDDAQVCETYLKYAVENGCTPDIARKWRKQWELSKFKPERDLLGQASESYGEAMQSVIPTMKCAGCQQMFEVTELMSVYMCRSCRSEILK
jgi:ParB family chromosome partitioning protein